MRTKDSHIIPRTSFLVSSSSEFICIEHGWDTESQEGLYLSRHWYYERYCLKESVSENSDWAIVTSKTQ